MAGFTGKLLDLIFEEVQRREAPLRKPEALTREIRTGRAYARQLAKQRIAKRAKLLKDLGIGD